ncbi:DUF887-domain-containing protein [Sanghuangporus baumii]|uniref:DUF887-domain-containing protein n=1 Tax=Sanghuangporus baumii TaxID=108892 RepID=A0A9Q5HQQ0_SANBA|nr:DUF887-domain-containing protein [Sanghuangporus baumii]
MSGILASMRLALQDLSRPFVLPLGITKLPEYAHVIAASSLSFFFIHLVLAPLLSKALFPRSYGQLKSHRSRNNWNIHIVSLIHALTVIPLAFKSLYLPALDADRAFGWDPQYGTLAGIACGYFIWDTLESLWHFSDISFVIHGGHHQFISNSTLVGLEFKRLLLHLGVACFFIYFLSFTPFIAYFGPRFLLWELSTPFLNIHWFLDKMNLTGSTIQLVNGILLLSSFAGARLVYGFIKTLFAIKDQVPLGVTLTYGLGNVVLNVLNIFWFVKMISALQKRMKPTENGVKIANGDANVKKTK